MIQYFKSKIIFLTFIMSMALHSCSEDKEFAELDFVGDSLVARWDLQASFPTSIVRNYGVSGSGVQYIESLSGKFAGKTVVVISGTNDISTLENKSEHEIEQYASRYIGAIQSLGAEKVYLYSIFPRGKEFNGHRLNPIIKALNSRVKDLLENANFGIRYINVYDDLEYDGVLNPQYSFDGLHLNIYGYVVIANALNNN